MIFVNEEFEAEGGIVICGYYKLLAGGRRRGRVRMRRMTSTAGRYWI